MTTDAELVRRTRKGNTEAFGELAERYREMVYGLGYHLTQDFEAARDLAQESFVQAFAKLDQLREPASFAAWLRRIAVSVHRDGLRRKEVTTVALDESAQSDHADRRPSEAEMVVRSALEGLRESDRLALTLHYIDGYTHAEIGGFLGVEAKTVKTRVARARKRLQGKVMQMVDDVFKEHALPPDFARDVIGAVTQMVDGVRAAVPVRLTEIAANLHRLHKQAWREIIPRLPAPYGLPLKEQGEAPQIRVAELSADLQQSVRQAMCYTWLSGLLSTVAKGMPWVSDPDSLWLGFYQHEGTLYGEFASSPGSGYVSAGLPADPETGRSQTGHWPEVEQLEPLALGCELPTELQNALDSLRRSVPGNADSIQRALHVRLGELLREVWRGLPGEMKSPTGTDARVAVRDLPEGPRQAAHEAVACHWGGCIIRGLESPDSWLAHFENSQIEFGVYARDAGQDWAGKEYVRLHGPRWNNTMQTGIAEEFEELEQV